MRLPKKAEQCIRSSQNSIIYAAVEKNEQKSRKSQSCSSSMLLTFSDSCILKAPDPCLRVMEMARAMAQAVKDREQQGD